MASGSASEPVKKVQLEGKVIAITGANRGIKKKERKKENQPPFPMQCNFNFFFLITNELRSQASDSV